jgi:hypothetical protein
MAVNLEHLEHEADHVNKKIDLNSSTVSSFAHNIHA